MLIRVDVTPRKGRAVAHARDRAARGARGRVPRLGRATPPLQRAHDDATRRCVSPRRRTTCRAARHRARPGAVAHDHADGDRQRLRVLDAQRGAGRAQHDLAGAGARRRRRRHRAHGLRALARRDARHVEARRRRPHVEGRRHRARGERARTSRRRSTSTWPAKCCCAASSSTWAARIRTLAAHIADAIQDWRDADDLTRPNGAEEADYRAAGLKYKPANAPFETVSELARVMGVTPAIYARVADSLTVYSRQAGINPATASRDVLLALPNATPEVVDAFLSQRARRADGQPARAAVSARAGIRRGRRAGVAHPRAGDDARWCNLRPRSGRAPVRRPAPPAYHAGLARSRSRRRLPATTRRGYRQRQWQWPTVN